MTSSFIFELGLIPIVDTRKTLEASNGFGNGPESRSVKSRNGVDKGSRSYKQEREPDRCLASVEFNQIASETADAECAVSEDQD